MTKREEDQAKERQRFIRSMRADAARRAGVMALFETASAIASGVLGMASNDREAIEDAVVHGAKACIYARNAAHALRGE